MTNNTGSGLGFVLGVLGLVALASYLTKKKCQWCNFENPPNATICFNCGRFIR